MNTKKVTASGRKIRTAMRTEDPLTGRWLAPDPLAEKYPALSPYLYCAGDPVNVVDPDGKEWDEKDKTIEVSVNIFFDVGFTQEMQEEYKSLISSLFDDLIYNASNGTFHGKIVFYDNNPDIEQLLSITSSLFPDVAGQTDTWRSIVSTQRKDGTFDSLEETAYHSLHEILHTIRLDHVFEYTQAGDTELLRIGPNSYISTASTDPNIVNNIMNYSMVQVDGRLPYGKKYLTSGQFSFIREQILLQKQGYGFRKNYKTDKEYYEYWYNPPGTPVH